MAEPAWRTVAPQLWPSTSMAPGGQVSLAFGDEQGCAGRWEPGPGSAEQGGRGAGCVRVCVFVLKRLPSLVCWLPPPVGCRSHSQWHLDLEGTGAPSCRQSPQPHPSTAPASAWPASVCLAPGAQGLGRSAPQPSRHPGLLTGLRGLVCTGVRTPSPLLNPRGRRNMVRWVP